MRTNIACILPCSAASGQPETCHPQTLLCVECRVRQMHCMHSFGSMTPAAKMIGSRWWPDCTNWEHRMLTGHGDDDFGYDGRLCYGAMVEQTLMRGRPQRPAMSPPGSSNPSEKSSATRVAYRFVSTSLSERRSNLDVVRAQKHSWLWTTDEQAVPVSDLAGREHCAASGGAAAIEYGQLVVSIYCSTILKSWLPLPLSTVAAAASSWREAQVPKVPCSTCWTMTVRSLSGPFSDQVSSPSSSRLRVLPPSFLARIACQNP